LDLYHRTLIVPAAGVQAGVPTHEASFPYGPTKVYYYLAIGWIYRLVFGQSGGPIDTFQYEALLKSFNVLFGLLDAWLVYLILTSLRLNASTAAIGTAMFVLNPALMFIMSIWGSTETISLFFMLLSTWLALRSMPSSAWIALGLGAFTRPQMLVLAFLLGCVYFRYFSLGQNLRAVSWTVITFFVLMAPQAIGIAPSFSLDYVTHVIAFQIGNGQADIYSAVSPGYYSIWTLPLLYVQNQHGINRMWYPRTADLIGSITYTEAGAALVIGFLLAVGAVILARSPRRLVGEYLPLVAFGMLGWLMLSTSLISRYFLYGLVMLILCRRSFRNLSYYLSVVWLSTVTLVTSWSHFGQDLLGSNAVTNPLNPLNSVLTRAVQNLFFNDRFITEATVANLIVLAYLGFVALKRNTTNQAIDERTDLTHAPAT
jgi:hypothetical protein